jgi:hypothetical protein
VLLILEWVCVVPDMWCLTGAVWWLQAQKFSIQKQLRKRFQRFMVSSSDYNNLLLTVLRGMAREVDRLHALTQGNAEYEAPAEVSVDKTRFEERAQVCSCYTFFCRGE